ncbi:MAG: hypothetical protein MK101_02885 [Phycisphaerales bacterium]|nr:hypothetical protein [Phycisphaerales bacterium]
MSCFSCHLCSGLAACAAVMCCLDTEASQVRITFAGTVEWNQFTSGTLGFVQAGDEAHLSFEVDAGTYEDSPQFPVRGYVIDSQSWQLTMGGHEVDIQSPYEGTPFFVLRDNDPAVDGFMLSTDVVDFPLGVQLSQQGALGPLTMLTSMSYDGEALSSLDILQAEGVYDFEGLSVFNWVIEDGPYVPLGVLFESLTIEVMEEGLPGDVNGDCVVDVSDVLLIVSNWGATGGQGDADGDGDTDAVDLLMVLAQWGSSC